jgi:hypothetical protein
MNSSNVDYLTFLGQCQSWCKKSRFCIIKEQEKWGICWRAYVQNNRSMGQRKNRFLGCIKLLLPHIPDLHTTTPLFGRQYKVMVYWCIPASLGTDGEFNGTWSKLESPVQRDKTSTRRACRH